MEVIVAANCGFCRGVRRAVDTVLEIAPENTYIYGELIHNEEVVKRIAERGIITVESLDDVPDGATLIIRSHGVGKDVFQQCSMRNIHVVDCTCQFVRGAQKVVESSSKAGKFVVIAGKCDHPEVKGLIGWCEGESLVTSSENDDFTFLRDKNVALVSQTTFSKERFLKIAENLKKVCRKTVEIFETICYTTVERQREVAFIANRCDAVIVIGGGNSNNTGMLFEIASRYCKNVIWLEKADDFEYGKILNFKRVGVIAGASTPDWQTQEVLCKMAKNNAEVQVTTAESVASEMAVEATPVAEEKAAHAEETSSSMAEVMAAMDVEEGYKKGQIIKVKIVSAGDEGIAVSGCGKTDNSIAKDELDCEEYVRDTYAQLANAGAEIEVMVVSVSPVKLSQKMVKKVKEEEAILKDVEEGKEFSVVCTGINKGGLTAELGTYPVFVPAREIRAGYVKELDKYVGKKLRLKLLEIRKGSKNKNHKEIIASQRVILEAEKAAREAVKAEKEALFFESINVGDIVEGKVERATNFGAFVSVNGFDCLAHISDLSWSGAKNVTDVLELGKRYEFQVLKIDREAKKVSIGYKQLQPQPWDLAASKYAEGDVVHGKVVRIVPFGAFVELEKGIDGLVHVSQISHEWLESPTSVLKIGEEVDAKILAFNPDERRITLSIKALQDRPEQAEEPRERTERPARAKKSGSRKSSAAYEDDEYREWNEGGYGGASIAEMLHMDEEK